MGAPSGSGLARDWARRMPMLAPLSDVADPEAYVRRPATETALAALEGVLALHGERVACALSGPPGIGKTLVLRVLARRERARRRVVFCTSLHIEPEGLDAWMRWQAGEEEGKAPLEALLGPGPHGRTSLLLVDEADRIPMETTRALARRLEGQRGVHIVLAGVREPRLREVAQELGRECQPVHLEPRLDPRDAQALLTHLRDERGLDAATRRVLAPLDARALGAAAETPRELKLALLRACLEARTNPRAPQRADAEAAETAADAIDPAPDAMARGVDPAEAEDRIEPLPAGVGAMSAARPNAASDIVQRPSPHARLARGLAGARSAAGRGLAGARSAATRLRDETRAVEGRLADGARTGGRRLRDDAGWAAGRLRAGGRSLARTGLRTAHARRDVAEPWLARGAARVRAAAAGAGRTARRAARDAGLPGAFLLVGLLLLGWGLARGGDPSASTTSPAPLLGVDVAGPPLGPEPGAPVPAAPAPEVALAPAGAPAAPRPEPVTIRVNARPWAEIRLDGRPLGPTPLSAPDVAPGRYELVAEFPDGRTVTRSIEVGPESSRFTIR